jgi:methylmalonyl-CoA mutase
METHHAGNREKISLLRSRTAGYSRLCGRRPRLLITRYSSNASERVVKRIAAAFADMGFDVDIIMAAKTPAVVARFAVENDVHAIAVAFDSSFPSERYLSELLTSLKTECGREVMVIVWLSTQPTASDASIGTVKGNLKIFGPKTGYDEAASKVIDDLEQLIG